MKTCKTCGKNIDHLHGNTKKCYQCSYKIKGTQKFEQITISLKYFDKLRKDSQELKNIKNYNEFLERTDK